MYRNIRGVHTFKLYDQPNLSKPEQDFAAPIGKMSDLFFCDIDIDGIHKADYYDPSSDGVFDICTDINRLSIRDIRFHHIPGESDMAPYLVSVGPKALTWPRSNNPEDGFKEIFNPNASPVVEGLTIETIYQPDPSTPGAYIPCNNLKKLVHERHLSLNPDFPKTMPRGGTGRGRATFA